MTGFRADDEYAGYLAFLAFAESAAAHYLDAVRHATAGGTPAAVTAGAIARLDQLQASITHTRATINALAGHRGSAPYEPPAFAATASPRQRADELIHRSHQQINRVRSAITTSRHRIGATRARLAISKP